MPPSLPRRTLLRTSIVTMQFRNLNRLMARRRLASLTASATRLAVLFWSGNLGGRVLNSIQFLRSIEYSCRFYAAAFLRWTSVQSQIKARVSCRQPLHVAQDSSRSRIVAPAARFAHRLRYDPKLSHIGLHRDKADVGSYWVFTRNAPSSFHQN